MTEFMTSRRSVLAGAVASGALLLPGCQSFGGFSLVDAVRRLLFLSSERAFARLTQPGGFWDEAVADAGLGEMLGTRGDVLSSILTSALFKDRLEDAFAEVAVRGAERAAPIVADAVRVIGIQNALALVNGTPTAATGYLRGQMGSRLIDAMVPEIGDALEIAEEPLVGELLAALTGVDVSGLATSFAGRVEDTIWQEMGVEEAAIRRDPAATNDPLLISVFGGASAI